MFEEKKVGDVTVQLTDEVARRELEFTPGMIQILLPPASQMSRPLMRDCGQCWYGITPAGGENEIEFGTRRRTKILELVQEAFPEHAKGLTIKDLTTTLCQLAFKHR